MRIITKGKRNSKRVSGVAAVYMRIKSGKKNEKTANAQSFQIKLLSFSCFYMFPCCYTTKKFAHTI